MDNVNRRHTVLINGRFQIKLIMKFISLNAAVMLLFGFLMYLFLDSEIQGSLRSAQVTYKNVKAMLFPIVITLSVLNLIFASLATTAFVLMASFRIAGPMYRFNQALQDMSGGKLSPYTKIREKDQLYECSVTLGTLAKNLSASIGRLKHLTEELETLPHAAEKPEIIAKLKEIKEELDKYETG